MGGIMLREGMADLICQCQEASPPIPFLIMSAGLGDVIKEFFAQRLHFALAETTVIVSNMMKFGDDGCLTGFSEPLMHMFNKNGSFFEQEAQALVAGKEQCLLLGD